MIIIMYTLGDSKVTQLLEVRSRVAILLFWPGFAMSLTHKYHTSGIF